jgi:two-component system, chemotaxis family, sensor kinase CheA
MMFEDNKDLFLEEARDLLAKIESSLVALELEPGDKELVNEIFRALHTIKGSGAMFGFKEISDFTHHVENLFDELRQGKHAIDSLVIDIGLRSVDCISSLLDGSDGGEDRQGIVRDIEGMGKEPAAAAAEAQEGLLQVYRITFTPHSQILHRGVRIESLFRELSELGTCHFDALTDALPDLATLDPTALYLAWSMTLSTRASLVALRSVFMFVEDYSELAITPIELENGEGKPAVPRLGEILVDHGVLEVREVEEIRAAQKLFGEAAIESGKVSKKDVESALAEQAIIRSATAEREIHQESATVRVKKEKLDSLIDLVGELVILQAMLEQEAKQEASSVFGILSENLSRLTSDLRDTIMGIRMVPLAESFGSFQRLVRDLAHQLGKELLLEISGGDTELDKNVIELLKDPLVHIIRNSADHGIEFPEAREKAGKPRAGTISLGARQVGSRVEIAIADDGAGLDLDKIRSRAVERRLLDPAETDKDQIMAMIFEPGFSTAEKTTGVSGRGVGMDVVKRNIERLRGEVSLRSEPGKGLTVTLSIPLTLVIIEGLLVRIAGHEYVITLSQVEECVDLDDLVRIGGGDGSIINLRGNTIPVISLRENLGIGGAFEGIPRLVIVASEGTTVGLMVDEVLGRKQVVIKPLSSALRSIKAIFGATILGDGSVALILDVAEIIKARTSE